MPDLPDQHWRDLIDRINQPDLQRQEEAAEDQHRLVIVVLTAIGVGLGLGLLALPSIAQLVP